MALDLEQLEIEFYLLLMRIFVIQCARRAQQRQDGHHIGPRKILTTSRQPWHIFLDCLCTLCDAESGGATTTSIGVEQVDSKSIFWIATNERSTAQGPSTTRELHLQDVRSLVERTLQDLAGLKTDHNSASAIQLAIFRNSVNFCKKRIAHYRKYALKFIASIKAATCSSINRNK